MKILHTSDWHLGQNFKGRTRESEHKAFLEWLLETITKENIDLLIVAGDIFDTANPPNYALKLYHNFLSKLIKTDCRYVVIVGGNHDSVSTLEVSKEILKFLNIYVIADGEDMDDGIIKVYDEDENLELIVCAVPFLRERVIRNASITKSFSEVEQEIKEGIKSYYRTIFKKARAISLDVPVVATGHLTTVGASVTPDSEREIYIGKLQNIDANIFDGFDYVALGHIHKPQKVAKNDSIRYSGSPLALSFSEASTQKSVVLVELTKTTKKTTTIKIPTFRKLYTLKGSLQEIKTKIQEIADTQTPPFVEVVLSDEEILSREINDFIYEANADGADVLGVIKERTFRQNAMKHTDPKVTLKQLTPKEVFSFRLEDAEIEEELQEKLMQLYDAIVEECKNEDH